MPKENDSTQRTESLRHIVCPYCGYRMPITYGDNAVAKDVWVRCKGKHCKKLFEIELTK